MVELSKTTDLPSVIKVEGKPYYINTDFQFFINFSIMILKPHPYSDYDVMYNGEIPENRAAGFEALKEFALRKEELPRDIEKETDAIILDYEKDEDYIYSAFWQCYGIDLKAKNLHLHWYKFKSLLNGLIGTKLNKIMEWRSYVPKENDNAEYKKYMLKQRAAWKIEKDFTDEEQAAIDKFESLLK